MKLPRQALALSGVVSIALLAIVARGDAPADQYAIFQAQTPTIKDVHALLEWERFPEDNRLAGDAGADGGMWAPRQQWDDARKRCLSLGGGWRLPTVKELLTIIDEDPHQVYVDGGTPWLYVDRNAFPTAAPAAYWTSSVAPGLQARVVDFSDGTTRAESPTVAHYNRCVRVSP